MKNILTAIIIFTLTLFSLSSCHWAKDKTKKAINKTGEVVGKTGSEFGNGVYKGVKKTFTNDVKLSDKLKDAGLKIGETIINSTDSTTDNVLSIYMIFNANFNKKVKVKVFDEDGKEYGRIAKKIHGEKGSARYIDFNFDKHVIIGRKGNISIEQVND